VIRTEVLLGNRPSLNTVHETSVWFYRKQKNKKIKTATLLKILPQTCFLIMSFFLDIETKHFFLAARIFFFLSPKNGDAKT